MDKIFKFISFCLFALLIVSFFILSFKAIGPQYTMVIAQQESMIEKIALLSQELQELKGNCIYYKNKKDRSKAWGGER